MYELRQTELFADWFAALRDEQARERIAVRLARIGGGLFGDAKSVSTKVRELRIDHGPGYRIYFMRSGMHIIVLLCGGDKSSQRRDIERAVRLAADWEDGE